MSSAYLHASGNISSFSFDTSMLPPSSSGGRLFAAMHFHTLIPVSQSRVSKNMLSASEQFASFGQHSFLTISLNIADASRSFLPLSKSLRTTLYVSVSGNTP
uniref:Uncharacterized protein n=1 Tax=Triticum urartu TaxID=4572 RepID=A0A8R7QQM4_TRIUA